MSVYAIYCSTRIHVYSILYDITLYVQYIGTVLRVFIYRKYGMDAFFDTFSTPGCQSK